MSRTAPLLVLCLAVAGMTGAASLRVREVRAGAAPPAAPAWTLPPARAAAPAPRAAVAARVAAPMTHGPGAIEEARERIRTRPPGPARDVDRWLLRLAVADRRGTDAALRRMAPYRPWIERVLRERGVPADLLALPLIESGYLPTAKSPVGAVGMWQFMAPTARSYGLEVSAYVDERRDPVRATEAAVRYLSDLHRELGSWHIAAAAYNAGQGRVGSALRRTVGRSRGDDLLYWQGRGALPPETRDYVPKLLAAAAIVRDPAAHGFAARAEDPLRYRELVVPGGVSLARVAAFANVPLDRVHALNPHLVRQMTPPGRSWPVRLPVTPGPVAP